MKSITIVAVLAVALIVAVFDVAAVPEAEASVVKDHGK
jgi:hypothetical protein